MTDAPTLNGQVLGQAERATRAVLDVLLAETDTPFNQWVSLLLLSAQAQPATEHFVAELANRLRISDTDARVLVDDLTRGGLAVSDGTITLTTKGRALYERISFGVAEISRRLYHDIPRDDLVTARRVLETLTDRARAELALGPR